MITQKMVEKLFDYLEKILPSGSGINGDWEFSFNPNTKNVRMSNYYHVMENGFYVCHIFFTAIINWTDPEYFKLQFNDRQSTYHATKHDLRDYLTDTICQCLDDITEDDLSDNI